MRTCTSCGRRQPASNFYRPYESRRTVNRRCKDCWRASDRDSKMLKRYGITFTEYKALLIKQRYRCAACRTDEPGGRGRFHVDHDHETGEVRGLLCTNCNLALGLLKDDVHRVRRLLRYLKR